MDLTHIPHEDLNAELRRRNKIEEKRQQEERFKRYQAESARVREILRTKVAEVTGYTCDDDTLGDIIVAVQEYEEAHP